MSFLRRIGSIRAAFAESICVLSAYGKRVNMNKYVGRKAMETQMKVILKADVKGHGKKGDLVNASDGYAKNYLIPKGLAVVADKASINVMEGQKSAAAFHKSQEKQQAEELAAKLNEITVRFQAKAGDNGKLFGSITSKDVSEQIKMQHLIVDKKKLVLPDGIKVLGVTNVSVKVYPEITASVKVEVTAE